MPRAHVAASVTGSVWGFLCLFIYLFIYPLPISAREITQSCLALPSPRSATAFATTRGAAAAASSAATAASAAASAVGGPRLKLAVAPADPGENRRERLVVRPAERDARPVPPLEGVA